MSRTVSADELGAFIDDQRRRIAAAFREVEQVQVEYQGAYTRFKADHDRTLAALADVVEAQEEAVGPALRAQIEARVPAERQAIAGRITALEKKLRELRAQADAQVQQVQQMMAELRALNPQLNAREEALKSQLAARQQELADLNARVRALGRGLGFITHVGQIHALDRQRHRVLGQLQALGDELSKVRQQWQDERDAAIALQAESQAAWREMIAQIGRFQQELDALTQSTEAVARRRAIVYVLDNLKTPASASVPALDAQLQQMIALNVQTDDFQVALGAVAGILGLLRGVDEGLQRFRQSVNALADEQRRHSPYLRPLRIPLPDRAVAFGANWDDLAAKSKDEKALAEHPAAFMAAMQPFLDQRLTKANITGFFDELSQAIGAATASWKG